MEEKLKTLKDISEENFDLLNFGISLRREAKRWIKALENGMEPEDQRKFLTNFIKHFFNIEEETYGRK